MALTLAKFNELVDQHGAVLYRMAYRLMGDAHEAEDAVQEAFRSAWNSRGRFQTGRGDRAWLAAILRRRIVDRYRHRHPPVVSCDVHRMDPATSGTDPLAGGYVDEVQSALDRLPAEIRETLLLVVVGELTHQEVAHLLRVPLGTVLSRVSRGRERLRRWLIDSDAVNATRSA